MEWNRRRESTKEEWKKQTSRITGAQRNGILVISRGDRSREERGRQDETETGRDWVPFSVVRNVFRLSLSLFACVLSSLSVGNKTSSPELSPAKGMAVKYFNRGGLGLPLDRTKLWA